MGLSIRAYARHRGVSDTAVHKAIRTGRITPEADGTIDPQRADRDWAKNSDTPREGTARRAETVPVKEPASEPVTPAFHTGGTSLLQARTVNEVVKAQTNKLRLAHLEPLAQRITVRYALPRLDRAATRLYLEHRLRLAGVDRPLFDEPALESLFAASGGLMRQVDSLAHHALAAAALGRARLVDADHVLRAAEETRA